MGCFTEISLRRLILSGFHESGAGDATTGAGASAGDVGGTPTGAGTAGCVTEGVVLTTSTGGGTTGAFAAPGAEPAGATPFPKGEGTSGTLPFLAASIASSSDKPAAGATGGAVTGAGSCACAIDISAARTPRAARDKRSEACGMGMLVTDRYMSMMKRRQTSRLVTKARKGSRQTGIPPKAHQPPSNSPQL